MSDQEDQDLPPGGFRLAGGEVRVVALDTSEEVDRPDIAARGLGIIGQAISVAGGTIVNPITFRAPGASHLRLVDGDKVEPTDDCL